MIFLIEYDRREGLLVTLKPFDDAERSEAENYRFGKELVLARKGIDHEVVLLEAANEEVLRWTHRRYFRNLTQLLQDAVTQKDAVRVEVHRDGIPPELKEGAG